MAYALYRGLTWTAWALALPWLAWKRARGGREWRERLGELPACRGCVWVHAASVGEVAAAAPLVDALLERGDSVLLTVLTPTGRAAAERLARKGAVVSFPPLDLPAPVERALEAASPRALLVVETELWPSVIVRAGAAGAGIAVVNARLSESSVRRYASPFFPLARVRAAVSAVACRTEEDRERFLSLGFPADRMTVTGNLKYDALPGPLGRSERASLRADLSVREGAPVVVFGSVRPDEEAQVVEALGPLLDGNDTHVVLAPRHLDRAGPISRALADAGVAHVLRSRKDAGGAGAVEEAAGGAGAVEEAAGSAGAVEEAAGSDACARVTVLDTTGELGRVYGIAEVAFVGGTLAPYGGHNPLEPAALGVPVVIGPHTESCAEEAALLVERGAARRVADAVSLSATLVSLLSDPVARDAMSSRALEVVASGAGAADRTLSFLARRGVFAAHGSDRASSPGVASDAAPDARDGAGRGREAT